MNRKEKIKTIVSYIIRENPCIINAIKNSNNTHNQRFLVQINNDAQSLANKGGGQIILGLGNLPIMLDGMPRLKAALPIAENESIYINRTLELNQL